MLPVAFWVFDLTTEMIASTGSNQPITTRTTTELEAKVVLTALFLSSLFFFFFSAQTAIGVQAIHVAKWQKKPWMNHGAGRGSHVANPAAEDRYRVRKSFVASSTDHPRARNV
ncbi:hypothetical protein ACLOJK_033731 [Asimina triloba]